MSGARMSGSAKIIEEIEQGKSHSQVSRERNIPRSTISTIFENKFAIKSAFLKSNFSSTLKRDRDGEFPEIEEALFRWIRQANAMKLAINGNILKEKAILLALKMGQDNFEASNGWLEKFKARRNIAFKRLHGEAGSVDANSVATWKGGIIPSLLAKYSPQDIFNADETGLFYKLLPNQTMTIRGEKCEGGFVMDEAMEEVVEEEMNRCFEALKKHQAIDVNYIDFLEVDKDVQVAGEQSIEEIVKEVMGKEEDEEISNPCFAVQEAGDFSAVAFQVLRSRCPQQGSLTIAEVNSHLDTVAASNNAENKDSMKKSLLYLLRNMSALEQKWLIRMILKEMRLGISENTILKIFHPDAIDLYDHTTSLENVCLKLPNPKIRLHEIEIKLFSHFRPMLAEMMSPAQTLGNVTELRRSRHLQGREPILEPLPQRIKMEDDQRPTVSGSYLPCQRQRDPFTFSGDRNINPGQWLKEYERVSKYNRWDETMKLANVVFYLNGTAGRWFDNNEESLNSWRSFEDAFRGVFGLKEDSARCAEEVLKSRAQKAEESSKTHTSRRFLVSATR
ncbi:hypothetical protein LAZ67_21001670 [Cordylochernes scorpioides]|uniref:HTH CENPB-type domain-containing protein n=1 Tax=Cordylochernes scorpioides TaxID=51811 RepID=A0ABY6LM86_9ARAC|nr:hypothetical protein LAZ67_21001670 [Cordylochernes scorpioides]